ncbi:MAG TPA: sugar transferase [Hungateiclostridium thermocellum]|jgi:lipopolysaccharide/colanic/teichoic acid biosynthesis glycosyltransferase|uniref:Sugar transferase n=2 Tax=Acetivibrio thermocellus TaxID=1515 RepID=A3DIR8_ACET2|nr:sugar transferase [Acetivibrio thermocellus]CDG37112.1 sugar transferase [Acetivibrio thermocellus BC1]ABN53847.1 sugar transferase [Acetivibrio thermocellus ATCC 27405]ADU73331.1 sugar transferase [Acetivibrio thermocellus DSM 1313]ALX07249.1 sugar transferase [Acetivibrio thermocellus AD2]ANV74985.1 sugar transferase [Acetivibrio thermocellus DSM 2360]
MGSEVKQSEPFSKTFYRLFVKRAIDIFVSATVLLILMPLFIIIGILIKIDSEGPVIYKQKRVGKGGKDFYIYKFRTMYLNADKIGPTITREGDSRITRVGKVLRKFSIDELPQMLNVLLGQMSLVGYRPGVRENYSESDLKSKIFDLKPGITGYAQVMGRSMLTKEEKRNWELKYAEDVSFLLDLKILLLTIKKVFLGEAAY